MSLLIHGPSLNSVTLGALILAVRVSFWPFVLLLPKCGVGMVDQLHVAAAASIHFLLVSRGWLSSACSPVSSCISEAHFAMSNLRVRSQQGVRECEGPPHNYSSSFPAGVHAPGFRLSAKVTKVEGCAWLYAHQSPDRSHSQRISNRCEGFITFLSLSAERGCHHLSGEQVPRKSPVFVKRGCGANTR